jgi:hypothetical protein
MIKHAWTIVCQRGVVDRYTNLLSILEVIDEFQLPKPADEANVALPVRAHIVSYWRRADDNTPARGESKYTLYSPSGRKLLEVGQELDLSQCTKLRGLVGLPLLPIRGEGTYLLKVELKIGDKKRRVDEVPIHIKYIEAPPAAGLSLKRAKRRKRVH